MAMRTFCQPPIAGRLRPDMTGIGSKPSLTSATRRCVTMPRNFSCGIGGEARKGSSVRNAIFKTQKGHRTVLRPVA
jgi:hypothetical protein